jgi:hypothetical protein
MKLIDNGSFFLDQSPALAAQDEPRAGDGSCGVDTLSRIMKSIKEERKSQVRLSKRKRVRFRKNSLWDKRQRNGMVICIEPKNYQEPG